MQLSETGDVENKRSFYAPNSRKGNIAHFLALVPSHKQVIIELVQTCPKQYLLCPIAMPLSQSINDSPLLLQGGQATTAPRQ